MAPVFGTTLLCLVSGSIAFYYIPESYKHTFYKQQTFKQYMEETWEEKLFVIDHKQREWTGHKAVRAHLPTWCSMHYVPKEKLLELYRERWPAWCNDPPDWFDDDFKAAVPRELLVEVNNKLWGPTTKEGSIEV